MNVDPNVNKRHKSRTGGQYYLLAILSDHSCRLTGRFTSDADNNEYAEYSVGETQRKRWRDANGNWQPVHFMPENSWTETVEWIEL